MSLKRMLFRLLLLLAHIEWNLDPISPEEYQELREWLNEEEKKWQ